jgi:hypothetical protein
MVCSRCPQDLRRSFYAFAQTSACPLIAIMGEDSSSDSENAVSSVLRCADFQSSPDILTPPPPPPLQLFSYFCSGNPYVTVIEISEPTPLAMARALSRLLPFPIPDAKAKDIVSQVCADVRSMSASPLPPSSAIASNALPCRSIALSLLRLTNDPQVQLLARYIPCV